MQREWLVVMTAIITFKVDGAPVRTIIRIY